MRGRRIVIATAAAAGLVALLPFTVSTQRPAAPPLVITAYNDGAPIPYTTPRTPWGDPDLQGVWSSDDTAGIPRERPANLGNRLYQTDEEWAARQKQVSDGVRRGENAVGSFRNDYATPRLPPDVAHRRPARRPSAGGHARGREAPRTARSRHVRQRAVQLFRGLHAVRPLHHPRHRRLGAAGRLWQRQPHRAGARHGGVQLRDDPRHARLLHRRAARTSRSTSASISAIRAPAGKATNWWWKRRTSPTRPASAAMATACATATR